MVEKINIAIADDHTSVREGLISLLEKFDDIRVIFDANNGLEVMEKLKTHKPDIILMDLDMEVMNGEETFELIKEKYPSIRVMILTGHFNESFVVRFIKKQISSIQSKTTSIKKIVDAIRMVRKNGNHFDEVVSAIMARAIADSANDPDVNARPDINLNTQEMQVLKLMCLGYTTKQIADKVRRSDRTIDSNRNSIWHKTAIKSKQVPDLILFALKHKIISVF